MKKGLFFIFTLLWLTPAAQAEENLDLTLGLSANLICIQKNQPAVSPTGVCQIYSSSCDVPEDWKSIPSCDLASKDKRAFTKTLAERMLERFGGRIWNGRQKVAQDKRQNAKTYRQGSGQYTRINRRYHRLSTSTEQNKTGIDKTSTRKNYNLRGLLNRKRYSRKGGYDTNTDVDTPKQENKGRYRPGIISRNQKSTKGTLSNVRWKVQTQDHFRTKNYGKKPLQSSF